MASKTLETGGAASAAAAAASTLAPLRRPSRLEDATLPPIPGVQGSGSQFTSIVPVGPGVLKRGGNWVSKELVETTTDGYNLFAEKDYSVEGVLAGVQGFSFYNIKHGKLEYSAKHHPGHDFEVPSTYRLATTLLDQLQRDRTHEELVDVGLPNVKLVTPLHQQQDKTIEVSARTVTETAKGRGLLKSLQLPESVVDYAQTVYGDQVFKISVKELQDLEETTRYCTNTLLPKQFFTFIAQLCSRDDMLHYMSVLRTIPFKDLGSLSAMHSGVANIVNAASKTVTEKQAVVGTAKDNKLDEANQDLAKYSDAARFPTTPEFRRCEEHMSLMQQMIKLSGLTTGMGFSSYEAFQRSMSMSLNQMASNVALSQKGYFMAGDASDGTNVLVTKTAQPIAFVSATGIDFCSPPSYMSEAPLYLNDLGEGKPWNHRFKGFKPGGEVALKRRVMSTYCCIFKSFMLQGCMNPSVVPMGLGVFLENVDDGTKAEIVRIYFEVQYELLQTNWGFETYWINAGRFPAQALEIYRKGNYKLKCNLCIHKKDAKFLAIKLANEGKSAGFLNPSDVIAVVMGRIGYYWEVGRQDRYVGEEDFVATSTAILAHVNVACEISPSRIIDATDMISPDIGKSPCAPGCDAPEIKPSSPVRVQPFVPGHGSGSVSPTTPIPERVAV